jgi:hypothetical protein
LPDFSDSQPVLALQEKAARKSVAKTSASGSKSREFQIILQERKFEVVPVCRDT